MRPPNKHALPEFWRQHMEETRLCVDDAPYLAQNVFVTFPERGGMRIHIGRLLGPSDAYLRSVENGSFVLTDVNGGSAITVLPAFAEIALGAQGMVCVDGLEGLITVEESNES